MTELKRCPFCGGEGVIKEHTYRFFTVYDVQCSLCCMQTKQFFKDKKAAIEAWNQRYKEGEK